MPTGMQFLNDMFPSFTDDMSTEDKLNELMSRVALMAEGMKYLLSNLGSGNFNAAELEDIGKTITEPISAELADMDSNLLTVKVTADSAKLTASNALGKAQSVELTVDGFTVTGPGGETLINGNYIKSGTIEGASLISRRSGYNETVKVEDGEIILTSNGTNGGIIADVSGLKIWSSWPMNSPIVISNVNGTVEINAGNIEQTAEGVIKLAAGTNMSIDSDGTIYIGASYGKSGDVTIGQSGGTVKINGDFIINGVPYAAPSG